MVGNENIIPFERELANAGVNSSIVKEEAIVQYDNESIQRPMDTFPHEGEFGNTNYERNIPRRDEVREFIDTFTIEFNLRLSQEMDSMMLMMHSQINRSISSAISDRVIPEIRSIVSSIFSSGNKDTEASSSLNSQGNKEQTNGLEIKTSKKDPMSAYDLKHTEDYGPYMVTGATDTQRQILEFLKGRIHSTPNLGRQ